MFFAVLPLCSFLVLLSAADALSQVEEKSVTVNKEFTIALDSNRTTGYSWEVSFDKAFLKLMADYYKPPTNQRPGAGGAQNFTFLRSNTVKRRSNLFTKDPGKKASLARKYLLYA